MDNQQTLIIILVSIFIATCLFVIISISLQQKWLQRKNYSLFLQQHLTKTHYQVVAEHLNSVRKFRHDIANHIHTLNYLIETETDNTIFINHKHAMKTPLSTLQGANYCNDIVIDAVVHNKIKECQNASVRSFISMQNFDVGTIGTIDLVALLYNLFDNAIDACQKISDVNKRFIEFTTTQYNNYLIITIKNSINPNKKLNHMLKPTKQSYWHGLGTSIIQQTTINYDGDVQYEICDRFFKLTLLLNNQQLEGSS
jgi:Signal transduction histidine kinase regulating citrate/malate metabolism